MHKGHKATIKRYKGRPADKILSNHNLFSPLAIVLVESALRGNTRCKHRNVIIKLTLQAFQTFLVVKSQTD